MAKIKSPGVYIVEHNAYKHSIKEIPTSIPAFVGYTAKALKDGQSLRNVPTRIHSLSEFIQYFGGAPEYQFSLSVGAKHINNERLPNGGYSIGGKAYTLVQIGEHYRLYNALRLFFSNCGGACYIVSVGHYKNQINLECLNKGLNALIVEDEPSMLVIPEAINLKEEDCYSLQQDMLQYCRNTQHMFGILDVYNGYKDRTESNVDVIQQFRNGIGTKNLDYGAVYYPWLNTTIIEMSELSLLNFTPDSLGVLADALTEELSLLKLKEDTSDKVKQLRTCITQISQIKDKRPKDPDVILLHNTLKGLSSVYHEFLKQIKEQLNVFAPSAAMAGVYAITDVSRGVWKSPANVALKKVLKPTVKISHEDQDDLNVTVSGKSVNAIRSFPGQGVLVWGARTLDGNSNEWRYISVRRTILMIEQSIREATKAYVFEANDVNTWTSLKNMIDNFLHNQWRTDALLGANPEQAYFVDVGLGRTMTSEDILNGIMRIQIGVALIRPAEFIIINLEQHMQES